MLRASASLLTIILVSTGAAHAQSQYDQPGYPAAGQYPPAPAYPQPPRSDSYDDDRAAPPGVPQPSGGDAYGAAPDLSRELNLRPGQQAAFQAYQAATVATAAEQQQMDSDMRRLSGMTTPERLDFTAAQMRRDEADFTRRADAVRRFYVQLSPDQQRRFDQLTGPDGSSSDAQEGYGAPGAPPPR